MFIFHKLISEVDLFGSCTFHQVDTYYSWFPDTKAAGRDAFTLPKWQGRAYAFPPVPLISLSLEKLERDQATAILVAPLWRSASWWDTAGALMVGDPWVLGLATKKIYKSRAAKFDKYCEELGVDPSTCAVEVIANFLAGLPAATASTVAAQPAALLPAPAAVEAWAGGRHDRSQSSGYTQYPYCLYTCVVTRMGCVTT